MSQNASNHSVTVIYEPPPHDTPKLEVDFSIFLIVGPIFIVFCIFVVWWDFFHGARVVPNCLYFSNPWNNDSESSSGKHSVRRSVEIYSPRDGSQTDTRPQATSAVVPPHYVHPSAVPQASVQTESLADPCSLPPQRQSSSRVSYSSSLPQMLTHNNLVNLLSSSSNAPYASSPLNTNAPTLQHGKRKCVTVNTGSRNESNSKDSESYEPTLRYRDPGYARGNKNHRQSATPRSPSKKLSVRNNVVLSKLSIERRAPPMWDKAYSKPQQQSTASESPDSDDSDLSEHTMMLKVQSLDLKRRLTQFFPDENLARYSMSLPKMNLKDMQKSQSCNILLKSRLSHFIPESSMSKSATCDVLLKSRLEDFIPDEMPTCTPSTLEEIISVKSDCPTRRASQQKKDLPPVNHQRANTWQMKATLYE